MDIDAATADTEVLDADPIEDTEVSPNEALVARIAQIEQTQQLTQRNLQQINAAVGRVQSLADKFANTNDPAVADKVRAEMANVYEVLGSVSDTLDPAILPESVKARVTQARDAARTAAQAAEVASKVREAVAAAIPEAPAQQDVTQFANAVEAQVVTEITQLGLSPDDPSFDWKHAASLLHSGPAGLEAMWQYFRTQERTLLTTDKTNVTDADDSDEAAGPRRRPRANPPAAGSGGILSSLDRFMDVNTPLDEKIKIARENGLSL